MIKVKVKAERFLLERHDCISCIIWQCSMRLLLQCFKKISSPWRLVKAQNIKCWPGQGVEVGVFFWHRLHNVTVRMVLFQVLHCEQRERSVVEGKYHTGEKKTTKHSIHS